jgi:NAD(P)-dependent dehydrogenase (short-subunit alcohol dehydrogenase family)
VTVTGPGTPPAGHAGHAGQPGRPAATVVERPALGAGLADSSVLCTGGAGGIGSAVAAAFAAAGARVLIADRDRELAEAVAAALPGPGHAGLGCDLTDTAAAESLPALACERLGSLDVLVNLAAVLRRQPLAEVTEADWDEQFDVNLRAAFFLTRACAGSMRATGRGGRIVLLASQAWWTGGYGSSTVYAASKGGLVTLTRSLAGEYGPAGITVNAIAPGSIDTPMLRAGLDDAVLAGIVAATPLGRLGSPEDIAGAAVFLASDHAGFITGTVLNVSGGWLVY